MWRAKPRNRPDVVSRRNSPKSFYYGTRVAVPSNTAGVGPDVYVIACAAGKRERSRTVCIHSIGSWRSAGGDNHPVYADRGEWADQRTISIEIDTFYNGFWYSNPGDDVPPVRGE